MKLLVTLTLAALLSGCVRNLRECPEPDYAEFARNLDEISTMRRHGLIDEDAATRLYAMEALALRTVQLTQEECQ